MKPGSKTIAQAFLQTALGEVAIHLLDELENAGVGHLSEAPMSIRILVESVLRNVDGRIITEEDVVNIASWKPDLPDPPEVPFIPGRVLLQDFTGEGRPA